MGIFAHFFDVVKKMVFCHIRFGFARAYVSPLGESLTSRKYYTDFLSELQMRYSSRVVSYRWADSYQKPLLTDN